MRPALGQHQVDAVRWAVSGDRHRLLGDDQGLGKTATAITAFDGGRNLVIAPGMVIDGGTWREELATWSDFPAGWAIASYTGLSARKKTAGGGSSPVAGLARPEFKGPWDAVILDEAHYIKNRETNWVKTIEALAQDAGAVLAMTGTPVQHYAADLYTTLRVLDPRAARRGGPLGSYWRWVEQWFPIESNRFSSRAVGTKLLACEPSCHRRPASDPCEHYREFMDANLGDRFLRRMKEDVLTDLPPLTRTEIKTPMDRKTAAQYKEFAKEYAATIGDTDVEAWSDGARLAVLNKVTTSPWLVSDDRDLRRGNPVGGKFDRLRFDLSGRSRPTLVFAHYRDTVEACSLVAQSLGLSAGFIHGGTSRPERSALVQQFKDGRLDVLVGSLEVLAEGLTLTVADMAIVVELSHKPTRNEQAIRRVHRWGQTRPVTVLEYITPDSVDSHKAKVLKRKTDHQMRLMSARDYAQML